MEFKKSAIFNEFKFFIILKKKVIGIVHVIFAGMLSMLLSLNPYVTLISSMLPDAEFLFNLPHRVVFHSVFFLILLSILIFIKKKEYFPSFFIGFTSHLILDMFSNTGVLFLYPLSQDNFYIPVNSEISGIFVFTVSSVFLLNKTKINLSRKKLVIAVASAFVLLMFFSNKTNSCSNCSITSIEEMLSLKEKYNEKQVLTNGTICSGIKTYKSSSGTEYEIFELCNNEKITVWKRKEDFVGLKENKTVEICGKFTTRYTTPEIYYVNWVKEL